MVTVSLNRTGRAVAWVQLVAVAVVVLSVVAVAEHAELQREHPEEASINTRGSPEVMETAMLPFESTVTAVQVYISTSLVPAA